MKILVTGASKGIGRATALYFLDRGHEVSGIDIQPASIENANYDHYICDVRNIADFPALEPEIIINCAGVQQGESDIDVNLKGTINITEYYAFEPAEGKPALPGISARKPQVKAVVNIGSASGHTGSEFPEYAASKGGLLSYTKNVALRLAPGAICNSIDPGGVTTELNRPVMDDPELWNQIMELTPLKRWASPEEIAEWIYFISVNNRFMTGQNLLIDGGEAGYNKFIW